MIMSLSRVQSQKTLISEIPMGFIVDTQWFTLRGVTPKSIHYYVQQGWIERIVRGVYRRPLPSWTNSTDLPWQVVLLSLQHLMDYNIHLGAKDALDFNGRSNYVGFRDAQHAHFYGHAPSWIKRLHATRKITVHNTSMFNNSSLGLIERPQIYYSLDWAEDIWQWPFKVSSNERAILELINMLPNKTSFEYVKKILRMARWMQPELLMDLLKVCRSVKVKRLLFVLSELLELEWLEELDPNEIDFGTGPRSLVPSGIFDATYNISLPKDFVNPLHHGRNL